MFQFVGIVLTLSELTLNLGILSIGWWAVFRHLSAHSIIRHNRVSAADSKTTPNKSKPSDDSLLPPDKKNVPNSVPWGTLFSHPAFVAASIAHYTGAFAYFTIFSWLPAYFNDNFPEAKGAVYNTGCLFH